MTGRTEEGKFAPNTSGNPNGRPKGTTLALAGATSDELEKILVRLGRNIPAATAEMVRLMKDKDTPASVKATLIRTVYSEYREIHKLLESHTPAPDKDSAPAGDDESKTTETVTTKGSGKTLSPIVDFTKIVV